MFERSYARRSLGARAAATCAAVLAFGALWGCAKVTDPAHSGSPARHAWTQSGHVRLGSTDEPDALNPFFSHNGAADEIETLLFAYVFRYDARGNLMPEVARELPTYANGGVSRDNKTITLHIRPGLTWSDGAPLDARDLRFTWRAAINPANNTKLRIGWDDVASMDVPNRTTLIMRLKRVNSAIVSQIWGGGGGSSYPPLPEHVLGKLADINRAEFNTAPISSGPWLLRAWHHGASLEFAPNPHYWRGAPKLHALSWKIVPNPDTLFTQLQTHDIDVYDNIPENQVPRLQALEGVTIAKRIIANYRHLELNTRRPQLADVRVRRAIAQAIDWDQINADVYHGIDVRATSDIVPDSWAAPHIAPWIFDPARARRLLDAAGWTVGDGGIRHRLGRPLALTISATNKPGNEQAEIVMQQQLRAVGIDLGIKNAPASVLFAQDGPLYGGRYDLSWTIDTNEPEPDNAGNWSGHYMPPNGANVAFLNDPVITQTSEDALKTFDRQARKIFYQREEDRIHTQVPAIFLYWKSVMSLTITICDITFRRNTTSPDYGTPTNGRFNLLTLVTPTKSRTIVRVEPVNAAVVSWNTTADSGRIDLTVYRTDGRVSGWLPYVEFSAAGRRSLSGADDVAHIAVDIVQAITPISALEIRCNAPLDAIAVSTPLHRRTDGGASVGTSLDVPALSQYLATHPSERGWCSPASLAMLLAYWGESRELSEVARAVYDERYGGTGNWAFNMAYASRFGLRAAVTHVAGLDHAAAFIAAGIPLALSFAWASGELTNAPLDRSAGHLAVLRGFTRDGHPQLNDPALAGSVTTYDRNALERVWQAHGGAAFAVVPAARSAELVALANA